MSKVRIAVAGAGLIGVIAALGRFADWFVGSGLWSHLLPFAGAVLGLAVFIGIAIRAWLAIRVRLAERLATAPALVAFVTALAATWFALLPGFRADVQHLQALVGGQAAAEPQFPAAGFPDPLRQVTGRATHTIARHASMSRLQLPALAWPVLACPQARQRIWQSGDR